jgi:hypothetical protein
MNNQNFIKNDKFGNPFQVVGCKDKKGNGFAVGYVELGGKLYKLEPSEAKKEGVKAWVKITQVKKQNRSTSM